MAGGPPIAPPPPHAVFTTTPAPVATQRVEYAGFWRRFWGLFIDRFALGFVLLPIQLAMGLHMVWPFTTDGEMTPERLMAIVFGSISMLLIRTFAEWVYFAVFQSSARQATLGQMALGIRVTDRHGQRIGFARASGRYFASWVSNLTLGIGYIICVFSERRQTLHDMIAGTLVVRSSGSA